MFRKKSILLGMFLSVFLMASNVMAQNAAQDGQAKTIFSFKDELSLTDDQVLKLKALLYDEQSLADTSNNTMRSLGGELSKLIESKADMQDIRSKLEEISKVQVDASCRNIEDSRKVEDILSPDQLLKWKDIQKKFSTQART